MEQEILFDPVIKYGFVGLAPVLLAIIVWLVTKVLNVVNRNTEAMVRHAEVTTEIKSVMSGVKQSINNHNVAVNDLHKQLLQRPCLQERKGG